MVPDVEQRVSVTGRTGIFFFFSKREGKAERKRGKETLAGFLLNALRAGTESS